MASEGQISKLDRQVVDEADGDECAICMEAYAAGEEQTIFPCGNANGRHRFHTKCATRWLRTCSGTCPLCRTAL